MSDIIKPRTLSGFMELLPKEQLIFNKIRDALEETYRLYGFLPLDTPILEYSEILLTKSGGETEKQIYRFNKGDTDLTMRFDLTVPLAKYVAQYANELTFPFRRYQIGKVYRGERAQRGRFREFYQSDIDIIGDGELAVINDAEMVSIINDIFTKLGILDFVVRINNRKVLFGFFTMLGEQENTENIMRVVDKIEKIGEVKVREELLRMEISDETCDKLISFINISGTNTEKLSKLKELKADNEMFNTGVDELETVISCLKSFGVPDDNYIIDLSIARGLDYYTGTVYETKLLKHSEIGSICSGGRYDNLAGFYTNKKLPGVGISIGFTRLFYILNDMNYLNKEDNSALDVLVLPMSENIEPCIQLVSRLRDNGIISQLYYENKKFKNKINYADKIGTHFVIFMGDDEIKSNTVTIKNFSSGEQVTVTLNEAVDIIKAGIKPSEDIKLVKMD